MDLLEPTTPGNLATGRSALAHRFFGTPNAMRRWIWASLVANCLLIVSGSVVRLTGSGLGCDTWPRCNNDSYVAHGENGIHTYIEFGNRTLTFVLLAIATCTFIAALVRKAGDERVSWAVFTRSPGDGLVTFAFLTLLGIPLQGVIGGITVLTHLNPWVVALHLLATILLIVWCVRMLVIATGSRTETLPAPLRTLVVAIFWLLMLAIWLGTSVTGAGPHAGDLRAHRNNLNILWIARIHAWTVGVTLLLDILLIVRLRAVDSARALRMAVVLMGTMMLQGLIGYAQFFLGLPVGLVICHMIGIGIVTSAVSWLYYSTRRAAA